MAGGKRFSRLSADWQFEVLDVPWPHRAEVAMVECRQLRLAQLLDGRQDAGVHDVHFEVGVGALQFLAALQVFCTGMTRSSSGSAISAAQGS